jgi:hypothetical protein
LAENAVKETPGVVLIDEIDMHLHPNWQKRIVGDLKRIFPKVQFIATTHSPFVVQSLEADELINLERSSDVPPQDFEIGEIATAFMGVKTSFSKGKENDEELFTEIMEKLKAGEFQDFEEQVEKIKDPNTRNLLKMVKLSKEK